MGVRDYKQFIAGNYYHIYNRGNGKMDVYKDDQDYSNFLKRIKLTLGLNQDLQRLPLQTLRIQSLPKDAFSIVCYCLMPNHFHLLIRQNGEIPISMLINKVCSSYSRYFNKKYDHVGHLFQDRFKAVGVEDDKYLLWLSAYIHQNPKVAGLVDKIEDYKWSSYRNYVNLERVEICDSDIIMNRFSINDYVTFVGDSYEAIKQNKVMDKVELLLD